MRHGSPTLSGMAGITLEVAQASLDAAIAAHTKVCLAQAHTLAGGGTQRSVQNAELTQLIESIKYWEGKVAELSRNATGGGIRVRGVIPG